MDTEKREGKRDPGRPATLTDPVRLDILIERPTRDLLNSKAGHLNIPRAELLRRILDNHYGTQETQP